MFKKTHMLLLGFAIMLTVACISKVEAPLQPEPTKTPESPTEVYNTFTPTFEPKLETSIAWYATSTANAQDTLEDCKGYPSNLYFARIYSPNKIWYIAYCKYPDSNLDYTIIINTANSTSWELPFYKIWGVNQKGQYHPEGIKQGQMTITEWSKDGRYVFIEPQYCCVDGPGMIFVDGYGLFRLELNTGDLIKIDQDASAFSLSPLGTELVFYKDNSQKVYIENLETKKQIYFVINEKYEKAGIFNWSPDGKKIVFSAADENWFEDQSGFALYIIDLDTNSLKFVVHETEIFFTALNWLSNNEVLIADRLGIGEFILDTTTNILRKIDPVILTLTQLP
ncbi:MAG: PD40 domain-containing protein [Anaerolineales bacterium]|nr:PD40 domain-containing protein [Anaerolineales bacterium]